jgi:ArsR family transcriptional regulator, arsenate/arsenite/antimonite-responsive transcriptional repressor
MDTNKALAAFFALSQQTRLDVFRLLVKAGSDGLNAGEIASLLDVKQNTMNDTAAQSAISPILMPCALC